MSSTSGPLNGSDSHQRILLKRINFPSRPLSPTTESPSGSDEDEEQGIGKSVESLNETQEQLPTKRRKKAPAVALTYEQEEKLVEWLQQHPELYDKGHKKYKDIRIKNQLWTDAAAGVDLQSGDLIVWYKSMRTRFGKLNKKVSMGIRQFSSRDQWILDHFQFFAPHIYVCPNRSSGQIKHKPVLQPIVVKPEPRVELSDFDDDDDQVSESVTEACGSSSNAGPTISSVCKSDEVPFQHQFASSKLKTNCQPSLPATSSHSDDNMAHGYGYFLSTFVSSLHTSLLTPFYHESWDMVMRYHKENQRLKNEDK